MSNFVIHTDSGCDLSKSVLDEWQIKSCPLNFRFDGADEEYPDGGMPAKEFYKKMRDGEVAKTSAVNVAAFIEEMDKTLSEGYDILYLGFSSALSTTFNSARLASSELEAKYPERRIIVIDTLAASAGEGLLLYLAAEKRDAGASIEETADFINGLIPKLCHLFTVDDLTYLKRGGRVSPSVVAVGNLLGIKPVLYVDDEGRLTPHSKVRGRRAAIQAMAEKFGELAEDRLTGNVFISHGDCEGDANELKRILAEKYGATVKLITDVGAVIGSHSGPGTLALFFIGKKRPDKGR